MGCVELCGSVLTSQRQMPTQILFSSLLLYWYLCLFRSLCLSWCRTVWMHHKARNFCNISDLYLFPFYDENFLYSRTFHLRSIRTHPFLPWIGSGCPTKKWPDSRCTTVKKFVPVNLCRNLWQEDEPDIWTGSLRCHMNWWSVARSINLFLRQIKLKSIQDKMRIIPLMYIVETVKVFFGLGLVQIFNVDEKSQVITLKVWEHFVINISHTLKTLLNDTSIETANIITEVKVMFSVLPVCPRGWRFPCDHQIDLYKFYHLETLPHPHPRPCSNLFAM